MKISEVQSTEILVDKNGNKNFPEVQRTKTFVETIMNVPRCAAHRNISRCSAPKHFHLIKIVGVIKCRQMSKEKMPKGCGGLSDVLYVCIRQRRLCIYTIRYSKGDRTKDDERNIDYSPKIKKHQTKLISNLQQS